MVHALREARRVLRPGSLLIDLRPAIAQRQVMSRHAGRLQKISAFREPSERDREANKAISLALGEGLFALEAVTKLKCSWVLNSIDECREWLSEFVNDNSSPSHATLLSRVQHAFSRARGKCSIVIRAPLVMTVLRSEDI